MEQNIEILEEINNQNKEDNKKEEIEWCVCLECGEKIKNKRGIPCRRIDCPECGEPMIGMGTKGQKKK